MHAKILVTILNGLCFCAIMVIRPVTSRPVYWKLCKFLFILGYEKAGLAQDRAHCSAGGLRLKAAWLRLDSHSDSG